MTLNCLLTGLDTRIGQVVRSCQPRDILTAVSHIKRELQLLYLEKQKFTRQQSNQNSNPVRKPIQKTCNYCHKTGHLANECHLRQRTVGNPSRPSPSPQQWSNNFQRPPQPSQPVQTNQTGSSNQFPQRQSVIRPNYSVPQRNTVLQQNPNFNYYQRNPKPTSNYPPRVNHVNPHYDDNIFEQADGFYEIDNYELTADDNDASETDDYPMDSYYEPQPQEYRDDTPQEVNFQNDPLLDRPPLELFEDMSEMVMDEVYPRAHSPQDELPLALIEDMSEMAMLDDEPSPQVFDLTETESDCVGPGARYSGHREYYRLYESTVELTKVSKLLIAVAGKV
nr:unnamed protein product [Callosobruchus analis]